MKHRVFVDGQEGTTGLRIHEYLAQRGDIEVLRIAPSKRKDAAERARLLNAADVAFLCLPDAAAREAAALVTNPNTCLIDASTAHRTAPGWVFGLPELAPDQRDAHPRVQAHRQPGLPRHGVHPAAAAAGRCRPGAGRRCRSRATSITGYSGGGKKMIEQYEAGGDAARSHAPRPYALDLAHKHIPEMTTHTGLTARADLHADRRQLLQGPDGQRAAAPVAAEAGHDARSAARGARRALCRRALHPRDAAARPGDAGRAATSTCRPATTRNRVDLFVFAQRRRR